MSAQVERIPEEELVAAARRFCRQIGAAIAAAIAETDTGFEAIDARLGLSAGTSQRRLVMLLSGQSIKVDAVSDFLLAMGCVPHLSLRLREPPQPVEPSPAPEAQP